VQNGIGKPVGQLDRGQIKEFTQKDGEEAKGNFFTLRKNRGRFKRNKHDRGV